MKDYLLSNCRLCPRRCGVDRTSGKKGYCSQTDKLKIARAALHMWEEPCISGDEGSGAVFFSGCSLSCVFCQNSSISHAGDGCFISIERLSEIFLELQEQGANNINLVTPTHYVLHIIDALDIAKASGLHIPVVYNTSCYESIDTLKMLSGYVDIWLPDFKYISSELSKRYSNVQDYFEIASSALAEMVKQAGKPCFDERGMMQRGVIVRHLELPGQLRDSKKVMEYLHQTYGEDIYISIMNQYTPMEGISDRYPELGRTVRKAEYNSLVDYAIALGVEQGFIQEGNTAEESFIPEFDYTGVEKGVL